jgi:hypothetical protein
MFPTFRLDQQPDNFKSKDDISALMRIPGFNANVILSRNFYIINRSFNADSVNVCPMRFRPCCDECDCSPCYDCYASVGWNDTDGVCRDTCRPCQDCEANCIPCVVSE